MIVIRISPRGRSASVTTQEPSSEQERERKRDEARRELRKVQEAIRRMKPGTGRRDA